MATSFSEITHQIALQRRGASRLLVTLALIALTVIVLLAGALSPPNPAYAKRDRLPALAGKTVIRATGSSYQQVRLTKTTRVEIQNVQVASDRGRLAVIYLQRAEGGAAMLAGHFRRCEEPRCAGPIEENFFVSLTRRGWPYKATLPPGTYNLYMVSDGTGVEATLRLKGLDGTAKIEPSQRIPVAPSTPPTYLSTSPLGENIHAAGMTHHSARRSLLLHLDWYKATQNTSVGKSGTCLYRGRPSAPPQVAYLPGCNRLLGAHFEMVYINFGGWRLTLLPDLAPGTWSNGSHSVVAGEVRYAGETTLWLPLR